MSVIIPYYKEPYLDRTIASLKENAVGDIEILAEDGSLGMRHAINEGLKKATGEYVMKVDAHCIFCPGYDNMTKDCQENWMMIPSRYSIDETSWTKSGTPRDYHYLSFPGVHNPMYGYSFQVAVWNHRNGPEIDDTMTHQGSFWMANRKYFMDHVGFLDDRPETYGPFAQEQAEEGLKYWLGGGEIKVNKKVWYAHLAKRSYHYNSGKFSQKTKKYHEIAKNNTWLTDHWMNNKEPNMIHKFEWLIDKFWPVPTWPDDWRTKWQQE